MKKVINRKVYNTETAILIAEWDNGIYGNDFRSYYENLYKTKKGAWFLKGSGGPASPYSKTSGNTSYGSSNIIPLSESGVKNWLEEKNFVEILEKYFAESLEEA